MLLSTVGIKGDFPREVRLKSDLEENGKCSYEDTVKEMILERGNSFRVIVLGIQSKEKIRDVRKEKKINNLFNGCMGLMTKRQREL